MQFLNGTLELFPPLFHHYRATFFIIIFIKTSSVQAPLSTPPLAGSSISKFSWHLASAVMPRSDFCPLEQPEMCKTMTTSFWDPSLLTLFQNTWFSHFFIFLCTTEHDRSRFFLFLWMSFCSRLYFCRCTVTYFLILIFFFWLRVLSFSVGAGAATTKWTPGCTWARSTRAKPFSPTTWSGTSPPCLGPRGVCGVQRKR